MVQSQTKNIYREQVGKAFLFFILLSSSGCSSWSWRGGSKEGERLTRVIHSENARLKDLVVQLRASNEDMAQRSLDDAGRISRLEEENQTLTASVAGYQTERERMAKAFQSLQQQVQVALSDKVIVSDARPPQAPQSIADKVTQETPPEGRFDASRNRLVLRLNEWFAADSAIIPNDRQDRIVRLAKWVETRQASTVAGRAVISFSGPKSDASIVRTGLNSSNPSNQFKTKSDSGEIDITRFQNFLKALTEAIRPDLASEILLKENRAAENIEQSDLAEPVIVIQF